MNEIFKYINGYENYYQIGNKGTVRSVDRYINSIQNGGRRLMKGKVLSPAISKTGYYVVSLFKDCKGKTFKVHRLIAIAFIYNPFNKDCINHKDGNKLNNDISNLEWCTKKENTQHAFSIGIMDNNKSKVKVYCIELDISKESLKVMANYFIDNNLLTGTVAQITSGISNVITKRRKQYRGYRFKYD